MEEFRIYQTDPCYWTIEVSEGFSFNDLTCDTMNQLADFLHSLGYAEVVEVVDEE